MKPGMEWNRTESIELHTGLLTQLLTFVKTFSCCTLLSSVSNIQWSLFVSLCIINLSFDLPKQGLLETKKCHVNQLALTRSVKRFTDHTCNVRLFRAVVSKNL